MLMAVACESIYLVLYMLLTSLISNAYGKLIGVPYLIWRQGFFGFNAVLLVLGLNIFYKITFPLLILGLVAGIFSSHVWWVLYRVKINLFTLPATLILSVLLYVFRAEVTVDKAPLTASMFSQILYLENRATAIFLVIALLIGHFRRHSFFITLLIFCTLSGAALFRNDLFQGLLLTNLVLSVCYLRKYLDLITDKFLQAILFGGIGLMCTSLYLIFNILPYPVMVFPFIISALITENFKFFPVIKTNEQHINI